MILANGAGGRAGLDDWRATQYAHAGQSCRAGCDCGRFYSIQAEAMRDRAGFHRAYGRHSGIPDCCIDAWILHNRTIADVPQVESRPWGYIPCDACITSGNVAPLHLCHTGKLGCLVFHVLWGREHPLATRRDALRILRAMARKGRVMADIDSGSILHTLQRDNLVTTGAALARVMQGKGQRR